MNCSDALTFKKELELLSQRIHRFILKLFYFYSLRKAEKCIRRGTNKITKESLFSNVPAVVTVKYCGVVEE